MEVSPICLSITFNHNGLNTFVSPFLNCVTAVDATASTGNILINPNYGGATINFGPSSTGISVIGSGSRSPWIFPVAGSYTAAAIDDGINISSYNAPGPSMTVTLPAVASLNPGAWLPLPLAPATTSIFSSSRTATISGLSRQREIHVLSTALIPRLGPAIGFIRRPPDMPLPSATMVIFCRATIRLLVWP